MKPRLTKLDKAILEAVAEHRGPDGKIKGWPGIANVINAKGKKFFSPRTHTKWTSTTINTYYVRLSEKMTKAGTTPVENGQTISEPVQVGEPVSEPVPTPEAESYQSESSQTDMDLMVTQIVRRELGALLKGVELMPVQKSGRGGGAAVVKKAFSIPADVWTEVEALGGIMSNHVTAALRIYLNLKREGKPDTREENSKCLTRDDA